MPTKNREIYNIKLDSFSIISTDNPIFIPTLDLNGLAERLGLKLMVIPNSPPEYLHYCNKCLKVVINTTKWEDGEKILCPECEDELNYTSRW
jgi:hypothetical protein